MKKATNCEQCSNYVFDEDFDYYVCEVNLDEDEMQRFLTKTTYACPYYQSDNEYEIVNKQV